MRNILAAVAIAASFPAQAQTFAQGYYVPIGQYYVDWAYPTINLNTAQARGLTGKGVTVAVFDTGFTNASGKFTGNMAGPSYNIYSGGAVTSDPNWHGTFVSSIIAANTATSGSAYTMYGVASSAKIMPIQVMNSAGQGIWTDGQLANGINFAVNNGAKVLNNSWGTNLMQSQISVSSFLSQNAATVAAYEHAAAKGAITVFAAGNYSTASPSFWATLPSMDSKLAGTWLVAVATDTNGALASYSNACGIAKSYCLAAPGSNILGVYGNGMAIGSGTSFAAPIVSGAVALLEQQWPYLTGSQITSILLKTATKTGIYANSNIYGQGMLNLAAATAPQGTVTVPTGATVADSGMPLAQSGLSLPSAFGKIEALGSGMMVLDDYGRAYSVSMNNMVGSAGSWVNMDVQLSRFGTDQTVSELPGGVKLGLVDDANFAQRATVPTAVPGLGNPYLSMGMDPKMVMSTANMTTWFSTHTYSASDDQSLLGPTAQPSIVGGLWHWRDWQIGIAHESNSIYGQQVAAGSNMATGADTAFAAFDHGWSLGDGVSLDISASLGYSRLSGVNQLVDSLSDIVLASGAVGLSKSAVFAVNDRLGMVVSMPNHTINGTAALNLPVSRDMDGNITYQSQSLNLVGSGTETDIQAYWTNSVSDSNKLSMAAGLRLQPEGNASAAPDGIALLRWNLAF
jgi:Subtilase family